MGRRTKILIIVGVILLGGGYEAKGFLMPPAKSHTKINGSIYILPKEFLVNLTDGRYGKVTVALVLAPGQSAGGVSEGGTAPPDGFGPLPEEAAIRDIITNVLTNQSGQVLISAEGRTKIKQRILAAIQGGTDVKVDDVLFTDVAVQ